MITDNAATNHSLFRERKVDRPENKMAALHRRDENGKMSRSWSNALRGVFRQIFGAVFAHVVRVIVNRFLHRRRHVIGRHFRASVSWWPHYAYETSNNSNCVGKCHYYYISTISTFIYSSTATDSCMCFWSQDCYCFGNKKFNFGPFSTILQRFMDWRNLNLVTEANLAKVFFMPSASGNPDRHSHRYRYSHRCWNTTRIPQEFPSWY